LVIFEGPLVVGINWRAVAGVPLGSAVTTAAIPNAPTTTATTTATTTTAAAIAVRLLALGVA
jgi:hypothetical protein